MKQLMRTESGLKVQQLDILQQALKLTANRFVFFCCTFRVLILPLIPSRLDSLIHSFSLYLVNYVWQYVWVPGVFQFTILCEATGRAYNTTSKRDTCSKYINCNFSQLNRDFIFYI